MWYNAHILQSVSGTFPADCPYGREAESVDTALFQQLNRIYAPLRGRALRLTQALAQKGIGAAWGWYANHSVKVDGEYQAEEFPIPVIRGERAVRDWVQSGPLLARVPALPGSGPGL